MSEQLISEILAKNPQGKMTMVSGTNEIHFDNGVIFYSESPKEKNKLWNKLKSLNFQSHYNNSSDEFDGLCQANQIGENPFKCTIMSNY